MELRTHIPATDVFPKSATTSPTLRRPRRFLAYVIAPIVINSALLIVRTHGYSVSGSILAINVASAILIVVFAWFAAWVQRLSWVVVLDSVTALLPFVLIVFVPSDVRVNRFGIFFAGYVFAKALVLVWYALANAVKATWTARVWVLSTSLVLYGGITPWVAFAAWPTGDEPYYLLLTHSLLHDHDFDLANNYERRDYKGYYPGFLGPLGHHSVIVGARQELPLHDVGISVLLLPGYAFAGRLGAMLEMDIVAALLALGIYELAIVLGASGRAALVSWALFSFTCPLVVYSSQIYPEIPGAAGAVWATVCFARFVRNHKILLLAMTCSLLAVLPWFSIRFWMIIGPMLSVMALYLFVQWREGTGLSYGKAFIALILPIVLSISLFAVLDMRLYHTLMPNAGYFLGYTSNNPAADSRLTQRPDIGLLGLLFDRSSGLVALAPVYLIAIAGVKTLLKTRTWVGAVIISASGFCIGFMSFSSYWGFTAWSPAGRYQLVPAALWAPVAALVLTSRKPRWLPVLSVWSFLVAIGFTASPLTRYPDGITGIFVNTTSPYLGFNLSAVFPSVQRGSFLDGELSVLWAVITMTLVWLAGRSKREQAPNETVSTL